MSQELNTKPTFLAGRFSHKAREVILFTIYVVLFISVIFSWHAITSICISVLTVASIIINKLSTGSWLNKRLKTPFLYGCFLFFFIQLAGLFYTNYWNDSIRLLFKKASILIFPLAICSSDYINRRTFRQLIFIYIHILGLGMLYCLGYSCYQYFIKNADSSVFFYHTLVSPVLSHAIHFSILSFTGLAYLLDALARRKYFYTRKLHFAIILFFFLFIILLASKLVIIVSLLYTFAVIGLFSGRIKSTNPKAYYLTLGTLVLIAGIVFFTKNPIQKRYLDITHGKINWIFEQEKFTPGNYLNGVQFRLLQWRFVGNILTEQKDWIKGVSLGDAQHLLNKKYTDMGLYIGDGHKNQGFLGYNTHNQFLESLLQSGIPGLLAFGWICFSLIKILVCRKNHLVTGFVILLLLYAFNEAYLESQYGMFIATFLPLFLFYGTKPTLREGVHQVSSTALKTNELK